MSSPVAQRNIVLAKPVMGEAERLRLPTASGPRRMRRLWPVVKYEDYPLTGVLTWRLRAPVSRRSGGLEWRLP